MKELFESLNTIDDVTLEECNENDSVELEEGAGADTKQMTNDLIKALEQQKGKKEWMNTASKVIESIPDDLLDDTFEIYKKELSNVKIPENKKDELISKINGNSESAPDKESIKTFGDILNLMDGSWWGKNHPDTCKGILLALLGIISVIEPTPVGEAITAIVMMLPSKIIGKIFELASLTNPFTLINKAVHSTGKDSANESISSISRKKKLEESNYYTTPEAAKIEIEEYIENIQKNLEAMNKKFEDNKLSDLEYLKVLEDIYKITDKIV